MSVEERAELEQLRQLRQHREIPTRAPDRGGDDWDVLHQLKNLPEDEAVALLLRVRSGDNDQQQQQQQQQQQPQSPNQSAGPDHPDVLCDKRLKHIRIRSWTQVPISNELAARLIDFYLTGDHPILGFFDANLFLGDLVAHKTEFCSPLLLSAVLCFACQGYSSIEPETAVLSYAFFNEAERLHSEESTSNPQYQFAIPNIAATQLLSLAATCHGRNELATKYLAEGIELAHQNGLLAVGKKHSARNWLDDHVDYVKAASHTAWGTFCRATVLGMNYQVAYIDIPSWLPIPGTAIVRADGKSEPFELPAYMGQSFTHLCRLAPLINEMLHQYYDSGDGIAATRRASFSFAQGLYMRLLDWADALPVAMARGDGMPHHVAIIHILFHTAVLDLFRPFPYQRPQTPFMLDDFEAESPTPEGVCAASVSQLKHLILVFRSQYPTATVSMLWQNALLYVANACLPLRRSSLQQQNAPSGSSAGAAEPMEGVSPLKDDKELLSDEMMLTDGGDPDALEDEQAMRRKWFVACIDALRALAPQFGIVTGIVQGILSMAILKGSIAAVEGRAIMDQLKADTEVSRQHRRDAFARSQGAAAAAVVEGTSSSTGGGGDEDGTGGAITSVLYGPAVFAPGALHRGGGGNGFVIDLNEAAVNPSAASLDVLARAFDELAMFDEFTNAEEDGVQN
ncbi:hypothetical protein Daus18300_006542 [Diaporthe australafricana]|uniref:Transcription factor domain-containing protein n=1 Tax=Diaporthe australafricana TaxID=127596 RepID=A0ABR3WU35_9PEZI